MEIPEELPQQNRIRETISCRDTDYIPKVPNAGEIIVDPEINSKYQVMHNGIKIHHGCYHGDWMSYIIKVLKGHHEPQEEKVFYEVLKHITPGAVIVELGCFWAYYSLWFCDEIPNAQAYLIEPNPEKLEIGMKNFELNGHTGNFTRGFIGPKSDPNASFKDWDKKVYKIPCITVDTFMQENNVDYIDILHSDIQGAEDDMLEGAMNSLKSNKIGYIFISTHPGCHRYCFDIIRRLKYHIIAQHTIRESVSGDGLIVACNPTITPKINITVSKKK